MVKTLDFSARGPGFNTHFWYSKINLQNIEKQPICQSHHSSLHAYWLDAGATGPLPSYFYQLQLSVPNKSTVYVFLHGESYEWNSGNPYDGSIIAAYNSAIFITINYRLGILGFFKAGSTASANLGLLDQVR